MLPGQCLQWLHACIWYWGPGPVLALPSDLPCSCVAPRPVLALVVVSGRAAPGSSGHQSLLWGGSGARSGHGGRGGLWSSCGTARGEGGQPLGTAQAPEGSGDLSGRGGGGPGAAGEAGLGRGEPPSRSQRPGPSAPRPTQAAAPPLLKARSRPPLPPPPPVAAAPSACRTGCHTKWVSASPGPSLARSLRGSDGSPAAGARRAAAVPGSAAGAPRPRCRGWMRRRRKMAAACSPCRRGGRGARAAGQAGNLSLKPPARLWGRAAFTPVLLIHPRRKKGASGGGCTGSGAAVSFRSAAPAGFPPAILLLSCAGARGAGDSGCPVCRPSPVLTAHQKPCAGDRLSLRM